MTMRCKNCSAELVEIPALGATRADETVLAHAETRLIVCGSTADFAAFLRQEGRGSYFDLPRAEIPR